MIVCALGVVLANRGNAVKPAAANAAASVTREA
jgi:hypothetical protein